MHYSWEGSSELLKLILKLEIIFSLAKLFTNSCSFEMQMPKLNPKIPLSNFCPLYVLVLFPILVPLDSICTDSIIYSSFLPLWRQPEETTYQLCTLFHCDAFNSNLFLLMPFINAAGPHHHDSITITMLDCIIVTQ